MRSLVVALAAALLAFGAACPPAAGPDAGPTLDAGPDAGPDAGVHEGPLVLVSPAEAVDLDPDPGVVRVQLRAHRRDQHVGGRVRAGYAYNSQSPGPTLRLSRGQRLIVELQNDLDDPTTLHWHGVAVPWAMDGALWQMAPVAPGESFTYDFVVEQAGTFWYHPHFDTAHQVDHGLYGALIVEDPTEPVADDELVVLFDDLGEELDDGGVRSHLAGRVAANGLVGAVYESPAPRRVRLRAVNVSNERYLALAWPGLRHIASDQGLLPVVQEPSSVLLGPGDRSEFELLVGPQAFDVTTLPWAPAGAGTGDAEPLFTVESGGGPAPAPIAWPTSDDEVSPTPGAIDVLYVLSGDPVTHRWLINGETWPDSTLQSVPLGEISYIAVRNVSPTEHPFHLHGHAFEVVTVDGVPPPYRTIEDTVNVPVQAEVVLRLLADNPGEWMAHCHILSHAEGGMMTVLRVVEPGEAE